MKSPEQLWAEADFAGQSAAEEFTPIPWVIGRATSIFGNDIVPGSETVLEDGGCGFAWVNVKPGSSALAKWLVSEGLARKSYSGGVDVWIRAYGQSMAKKEVYAQAFAKSLHDNGFERAYAESRYD